MNVVAHNLAAMNASLQYNSVAEKQKKSTEKLSSGYKINRAADDAAGLSISEKMRLQIRSLKQGIDNTEDGVSFLQIADGAMNEVHEMLHRMTELSVKAANGTNSESDRQNINDEMQQLKKEINRVGVTSKFNETRVFDGKVDVPDIRIHASYLTHDDINIFNAGYDSATGTATYGGLYLNKERIEWKKIDPDMVNTDGTFVAGTYTHVMPDKSTLTVTCKDGNEAPVVEKSMTIPDLNSFFIDGRQYSWEDLENENGEMMKAVGISSGTWYIKDTAGNITASVNLNVDGDKNNVVDFSDIVEAVNQNIIDEPDISWKELFPGAQKAETAAYSDTNKLQNITGTMASKINNNSEQLKVRADKNDMWLEEYDSAAGKWNIVTDSHSSWDDLGITEVQWSSGTGIGDDVVNQTVFSYLGDQKIDGGIQFSLLSRVTSKDSLIDALDGMTLTGNTQTDYSASVKPSGTDILDASVSSSGKLLSFVEEKALGRDFDEKKADDVADNGKGIQFNDTYSKMTAEFSKTGKSTKIEFSGDPSSQIAKLNNDIGSYVNIITKQKTNAALAGRDPQVSLYTDLKDVVGSENITTAGYFDTTVTLDSSMYIPSKTSHDNWSAAGKPGKTYQTAFIDFKNVSNLSVLEGCGFDSTCETCDNHYSVRFLSEASLPAGSSFNQDFTDDAGKTFKYSVESSGENYILNIDLDSLNTAKISDGKDLAKAVADIADAGIGFHYTKYATDGSKLYIYDNREEEVGQTRAKFYTRPYIASNIGDYNFSLSSADSGELDLSFKYDFGKAMENVIVNMKENNSGDYVKDADAGGKSFYRIYTAADVGKQKYAVDVSYKNAAGDILSGSADDAKKAMVDSFAKKAAKEMLSSEVDFNSNDYTKINWAGHSNDNKAISSLFESEISTGFRGDKKGIMIQHSNTLNDNTYIPQFPLNTYVLGLLRADCSTMEKATTTIGLTKKAMKALNYRRSLYGAYQNRLEHTINNEDNIRENTTAADSRIRDTDMAAEMVKYSNNSILLQAGQAMMAQANQSNQGVLRLLQG